MQDIVLGWPKSPFSFFHKIKDTFFTFTNYFTDLDILSLLATPQYWLLVVVARGAAKHLPMHKSVPQQRIFGENVNSTKKLHKQLLDVQSVTAPSPYTAQIFFVV